MASRADCGQRLKTWRKAQGLSQRDLATAIDVSQGYVGNIEAGRSEPSRNFLVSLQEKFGVRADYILYGDGEPGAQAGSPRAEQLPHLDPLLLVICGGAVSQEYQTAGVELPREKHLEEAAWMTQELLTRISNPNDGDALEMHLPLVRKLLRMRLGMDKV